MRGARHHILEAASVIKCASCHDCAPSDDEPNDDAQQVDSILPLEEGRARAEGEDGVAGPVGHEQLFSNRHGVVVLRVSALGHARRHVGRGCAPELPQRHTVNVDNGRLLVGPYMSEVNEGTDEEWQPRCTSTSSSPGPMVAHTEGGLCVHQCARALRLLLTAWHKHLLRHGYELHSLAAYRSWWELLCTAASVDRARPGAS